jgi:hypothetical protein
MTTANPLRTHRRTQKSEQSVLGSRSIDIDGGVLWFHGPRIKSAVMLISGPARISFLGGATAGRASRMADPTKKGRAHNEPYPSRCFLRYGKRDDGKPSVKCERGCGPWSYMGSPSPRLDLGHMKILLLISWQVNYWHQHQGHQT